ncbi:hypothetical protein [Shewanella insulae]|uniref:hypothetical protein n=1 Tax=Shewanella insulae TaxID=2681496 RepID=UPI0024818D7C|nr:hypothetical protein [Shewanella insulae]
MSGHYRFVCYFTLNAIALSLLFSCAAQAKDKDAQLTQETVLHETMTLPVDGALDSEGNPLAIPDNPTGALNYRASHAQPKSRRDKKSPSKSKSKRSKKQNRKTPSRKQQLASRQHVADDPSCRWLDKRMSHLEKSLKRQAKRQYGYQDKELRARQSEWVCMKCGAEGPSQSDHHKCQYRR